MKTVNLSRKSPMLHVEAPGCIVNISPGLTDAEGRDICHISIDASGDRYAGDPQWWVEGEAGNRGIGVRVIQTNTPTPPPNAGFSVLLLYPDYLNDDGTETFYHFSHAATPAEALADAQRAAAQANDLEDDEAEYFAHLLTIKGHHTAS